MLPLAIALPEVLEFVSALAVAFGAKKLLDKNKDDAPSLFGSSGETTIPVSNEWSDDTTSTVLSNALSTTDDWANIDDSILPVGKEDESEIDDVRSAFDDYVIRKLEMTFDKSDNEVSVNNVSLPKVDDVELSDVKSANLLETGPLEIPCQSR